MAEQKISTLTELSSITGDDFIEVSEKSGATYVTKKFKPGTMINEDADKFTWMFTTKTIASALSGDVVINPADGHRQEADVDGDITSLTCALSATYPAIILELTTDGEHTISLEATSSEPDAGWETANAGGITLPDTGKCIIVLFLSADGSTKYALLAATEVA